MKKYYVELYQTKPGVSYSFRNWDFAKDRYNSDDYNMVMSGTMFQPSVDELLDYMWQAGNDGTLQSTYKMRSVSMSDVIKVDDNYYYVDTFGFLRIGSDNNE